MADLRANITLRPGTKDDEAFIFSTWLKNLYFYSRFRKRLAKPAFMSWFHARAESVLAKASIVVACDPEESSVIYGYRISDKMATGQHVVHFVYVKGLWKKHGIATKLMEDVPSSFVFPHRTDDLVFWLRKYPGARHQPPIEEATI